MKKKFDFKEFMLAKGEKVALGVCCVLGGLFLLMGVMNVLGSTSASANAKELNKYSSMIDSKRRSAEPGPGDKPTGTVSDLTDAFVLARLSADRFRSPEMYFVESPIEVLRQEPNVLVPTEFQVGVALVPLKVIDIDWDNVPGKPPKIKRIAVVKGGTAGSGLGGLGDFLQGAMRRGYGFTPPGTGAGGGEGGGGDTPVGSFPGAPPGSGGTPPGGTPPGSFPPGSTPPGSTPGAGGPGMFPPGSGVPGFGGAAAYKAEDGKKLEIDRLALTEINAQTQFATTVAPRRMVIVSGAFPFRAQVEEFQSKLRLESPKDVLNEVIFDESKPKGEQRRPGFKFAGIEVERMTIGSDGKPITRGGKQWFPHDIFSEYKRTMLYTARQFAEESKTTQQYLLNVSRGLMMRRPLIEEKAGEYPDLVAKLDQIQSAIQKLTEKGVKETVAPDSRFDNDWDPLNPTTIRKPQLKAPPGGGFVAPGGDFAGRFGDGIKIKKDELIDHCLLRFIDLNVRPGYSYRYRVRIKMVNPNYKHKETYPNLRDKEYLYSAWAEVPQTVTMPVEKHVYLVDQMDLDGGRKKYKGQNPHLNPSQVLDRSVVLQLHQWVDSFLQDPEDEKSRKSVGEWLVAERLEISLGEMVRKWQSSPVPIKPINVNGYILAKQKESKRFGRKSKQPKNVYLRFGDESVLTAIEGGQEVDSYKPEGSVSTRRLVENVYREVAIVRPDGTLTVHNSADDAKDKAREARHLAWRERIESVKNSKDGKTPKKKDGPLFGGGGQ